MIFANQTVCSTSLDSKYSILGSYLKASKGAGQDKLGGRGSGWMLNSLSHLSAPRPASRDSRGYSKEEEEDALMDSDTKDYPQVKTERILTLGKLSFKARSFTSPRQKYILWIFAKLLSKQVVSARNRVPFLVSSTCPRTCL